jgi:hypothetical protein
LILEKAVILSLALSSYVSLSSAPRKLAPLNLAGHIRPTAMASLSRISTALAIVLMDLSL